MFIFYQKLSNNKRNKYIYQFLHNNMLKKRHSCSGVSKNRTGDGPKIRFFAHFSKSVHLIFLTFCMKLEGMVGHQVGLEAISRELWFVHNDGILWAKFSFLSISCSMNKNEMLKGMVGHKAAKPSFLENSEFFIMEAFYPQKSAVR